MPRFFKWAVTAASATIGAALPTLALAAGPTVFPTGRTLVPIAVATAFAAPALVAALFVALGRLGRVLGPLVGISTLGAVTAAVVALAQKGTFSSLAG
jgi:hypothetical protein